MGLYEIIKRAIVGEIDSAYNWLAERRKKLPSVVGLRKENNRITEQRDEAVRVKEGIEKQKDYVIDVLEQTVKQTKGLEKKIEEVTTERNEAISEAAEWEKAYENREGLVKYQDGKIRHLRRLTQQIWEYNPRIFKKIVEAENKGNLPIAIFDNSGKNIYSNIRSLFRRGKRFNSVIEVKQQEKERVDEFYKDPDQEMLEITGHIKRRMKKIKLPFILSKFYPPEMLYKSTHFKEGKPTFVCFSPIVIKEEGDYEKIKKETKDFLRQFGRDIRYFFKNPESEAI